jgi:hypothetical protein
MLAECEPRSRAFPSGLERSRIGSTLRKMALQSHAEPFSNPGSGTRGEPPAFALRDPQSADGGLAGLSRSRVVALGGFDALARGGLQDLLIE